MLFRSTQVVSVSDTSTTTSRMLEDSCSSDEHAPHVKFLQILQDLKMARLSLHLALQVAEGAWGNQQICACTKDTMDAKRELDDHTSTLHVGSKIHLHGLLNQALNGKKGTVLGMGSNNRIDIQLQGEQRQVSIRIFNIRYGETRNRTVIHSILR